MPQLPSTITARPTVTVDARAVRLREPDPNPSFPGTQGPFGRARVVTALPTNGDGPVLITKAGIVADPHSYVVDSDGNFVGSNSALYIHRFITARWVEDTRRLGG
jgi:hypothetical protein